MRQPEETVGIKQKLTKAAEAHGKGPEAFSRELDQLSRRKSRDQIIQDYGNLVEAATQGPEAVREAIQEITPDSPDWIQACWDVLQRWKAIVPHFEYQNGMGCSPREMVLQKLLKAARRRPKRGARITAEAV